MTLETGATQEEKAAPVAVKVEGTQAGEQTVALTPEAIAMADEANVAAQLAKPKFDVSRWTPKTAIGKKVKAGEITSLDVVLDGGHKIMEAEIVDVLVPNLGSDLMMIGQSKGKFGGGARRVFKQTQKKTCEGNKPKFATYAVVGDQDGHVGIGYGKSKETVPAREKAIRNAKLSIMKIRRGQGSWSASGNDPTSIPFKVSGKCGSVEITLMPAPKGTGLCVERECQKIFRLAGIKDIWSKTRGHTTTKINLIKACMEAIEKLTRTPMRDEDRKRLGVVDGNIGVSVGDA